MLGENTNFLPPVYLLPSLILHQEELCESSI